MESTMRITRQAFAAATAVGLAAAGGSAYTAANTGTPSTTAGQGQATASGYAVSGYQYVFDALGGATGDQIASVAFTLTPSTGTVAATEARIRFVATTGTYYDCTVGTTDATTGATTWTCGTSGLKVSTINTVDIAAVSHHA
jgi:hypothetical protein